MAWDSSLDAMGNAMANRGLAKAFVRRFVGDAPLAPSVDMDDLHQAAFLGLLRACQRYDAAHGATIGVFAQSHMGHEVQMALRGALPVHIPRDRLARVRAYRKRIERLPDGAPRDGLTADDRLVDLVLSHAPLSLDFELGGENGSTLPFAEVVACEQALDPAEHAVRCSELESLPDELVRAAAAWVAGVPNTASKLKSLRLKLVGVSGPLLADKAPKRPKAAA